MYQMAFLKSKAAIFSGRRKYCPCKTEMTDIEVMYIEDSLNSKEISQPMGHFRYGHLFNCQWRKSLLGLSHFRSEVTPPPCQANDFSELIL